MPESDKGRWRAAAHLSGAQDGGGQGGGRGPGGSWVGNVGSGSGQETGRSSGARGDGEDRRGGAEMSAVSKGVRVSACICACTCVSVLRLTHMCVMQPDRREGTSVPGCMTATTITGQEALVF